MAELLPGNDRKKFVEVGLEVNWMGKSGLSERTRQWYIREILKILKKHKRCTTALIIAELQRLNQRRYPITEGRITAMLKYLAHPNVGLVRYNRRTKGTPSKWEVKE